MTGTGGGHGDRDMEAEALLRDGKVVIVIDNLSLPKNTRKDLFFENKDSRPFHILQIERLESELIDLTVDGLSNIDFDFRYTPELGSTTPSDLPEGNIYRIDHKGVASTIEPTVLDLRNLAGFVLASASNKKIELESNQVGFFASAQSTTIPQAAKSNTFAMPYVIPSGGSIVMSLTNEGKLPVGATPGKDVEVDLTLIGYFN